MSDVRYQLIDFGGGRKLESFAGRIVDRPSPSAEGRRQADPPQWELAESYFDGGEKVWRHHSAWPDPLVVDCDGFKMPIRPTPFGHVGLFPEQFENWKWLQARQTRPDESLAALNLFAYTGASTMALVGAGFQVAHVDAAKPNVQAARVAAELNGWPDAPIRYLIDDAAKFAAREVRRQKTYHTIVLDPPAYGHSPAGKAWRLERDLWPLIDDCLRLVDAVEFRLLITGHSAQIDPDGVVDYLHGKCGENASIDPAALLIESGRSQLRDQKGRRLDAGFYVRAQCQK